MKYKSSPENGHFDRNELNYYVNEASFVVEKHDLCDLYLYGYHASGSGIRTWNDLTIHCRGLILNEKGDVKARSFTKFFTFRKYLSENTVLLSEGQVMKLPDCEYKIYDKLDGSLAILYWVNDKPYLASQRSFNSIKARRATKILYDKYQHVFDKLKRDRTYLFEAIYPESRVVVDYGELEDLYLIGVLDNKTGDDLPLEDIGFPLTEDITSEFEYIQDLKSIQQLNIKNKEGVVIVYENGLRIKVKYNDFQKMSQIVSRLIDHQRQYYQLLKNVKLHYGLPQNELTSNKMWKMFNDGYTPNSVGICIPKLYYHCGVQEWIDIEYQEFLDARENNIIEPMDNKLFDFKSEMPKAKSEMIMWNTIKDIENTFD